MEDCPMRETQLLQSAVSEYKCILPSPRSKKSRPLHAECLVRELCRAHDWTDSGARAVVSLANNYGAFMLRNALTLAIVLGKEDGEQEDGELGF
jgi:hypothetical protein